MNARFSFFGLLATTALVVLAMSIFTVDQR